jgi:hypothetical protein
MPFFFFLFLLGLLLVLLRCPGPGTFEFIDACLAFPRRLGCTNILQPSGYLTDRGASYN